MKVNVKKGSDPIIVQEPNIFFEDLLHPLVRKLFKCPSEKRGSRDKMIKT